MLRNLKYEEKIIWWQIKIKRLNLLFLLKFRDYRGEEKKKWHNIQNCTYYNDGVNWAEHWVWEGGTGKTVLWGCFYLVASAFYASQFPCHRCLSLHTPFNSLLSFFFFFCKQHTSTRNQLHFILITPTNEITLLFLPQNALIFFIINLLSLSRELSYVYVSTFIISDPPQKVNLNS